MSHVRPFVMCQMPARLAHPEDYARLGICAEGTQFLVYRTSACLGVGMDTSLCPLVGLNQDLVISWACKGLQQRVAL